MKFFLSLLLTILFAGILFTSCKKDSDDEKVNALTVGNTTAAIETLTLYNNGSLTNGYEYYIELTSAGITFDAGGYFGGAGSFLQFKVISSSNNGIISGDYEYDTDSSKPLLSYYTSYHCLNYVSGATNTNISVTEGTITVKRDNNNYEISFSGKDAEGKTVTAYYKGASVYYDWSAIKSSVAPGM